MKKIIILIGVIALSCQLSLSARHYYHGDGFGSGLAGGMLGGALTGTMMSAASRDNNRSRSDESGYEALRRIRSLEEDMQSLRKQINRLERMIGKINSHQEGASK